MKNNIKYVIGTILTLSVSMLYAGWFGPKNYDECIAERKADIKERQLKGIVPLGDDSKVNNIIKELCDKEFPYIEEDTEEVIITKYLGSDIKTKWERRTKLKNLLRETKRNMINREDSIQIARALFDLTDRVKLEESKEDSACEEGIRNIVKRNWYLGRSVISLETNNSPYRPTKYLVRFSKQPCDSKNAEFSHEVLLKYCDILFLFVPPEEIDIDKYKCMRGKEMYGVKKPIRKTKLF